MQDLRKTIDTKPCPFCGGKIGITKNIGVFGKSWFLVECGPCDRVLGFFSAKEKVNRVWGKDNPTGDATI